MITISHTHADGTVLTGSRKGDGVYKLAQPHGFATSGRSGSTSAAAATGTLSGRGSTPPRRGPTRGDPGRGTEGAESGG
jgi:hypothetical protein